jgi:hypothetical protein
MKIMYSKGEGEWHKWHTLSDLIAELLNSPLAEESRRMRGKGVTEKSIESGLMRTADATTDEPNELVRLEFKEVGEVKSFRLNKLGKEQVSGWLA